VTENELEDWDALIKTPGWQRLLAFLKSQWGSAAYQHKIERAIADAEEQKQDALTAIKIVNAVRHEIELILTYPERRMKDLDKEIVKQAQTPGRRGRL
jgi:NADH dehydrogenase FAD-containing subunit